MEREWKLDRIERERGRGDRDPHAYGPRHELARDPGDRDPLVEDTQHLDRDERAGPVREALAVHVGFERGDPLVWWIERLPREVELVGELLLHDRGHERSRRL